MSTLDAKVEEIALLAKPILHRRLKLALMRFVDGEHTPDVQLSAIEQIVNLLYLEEKARENAITRRRKHTDVSMQTARKIKNLRPDEPRKREERVDTSNNALGIS